MTDTEKDLRHSIDIQRLHEIYESAYSCWLQGHTQSSLECLQKIISCLPGTTDEALFFDSYLLLFRILVERENFKELHLRICEFERALTHNQIPPTPRLYYTLSMCALYQEQPISAREFAEKSYELALVAENPIEICHALIVRGGSLELAEDFEGALRNFEEAQQIALELNRMDLSIASALSLASLNCKLDEAQRAFSLLEGIRLGVTQHKSLYYHVQYLLVLSCTQRRAKKYKEALATLEFAQLICDSGELVYQGRLLQKEREALPQTLKSGNLETRSLRLDLRNQCAMENQRGLIDFKNQFTLIKMIGVLAQKKGQEISKSELTHEVWREDPTSHLDNKFYVNIKRLRNLIEPNPKKPIYLIRTSSGYSLRNCTLSTVERPES